MRSTPRALSREKGTYLLLLHLPAACHVRVGRLGSYDMGAGWYLYVGSAFGAGGLAARLGYHMRRIKQRPHWHIDYLRAVAPIREIWAAAGVGRLEQAWCRALLAVPGFQVPIRGFGASDTRAPAHLLYTPAEPLPAVLSGALVPPLLDSNPHAVRLRLTVQRPGDGAVCGMGS
jgi:Uri superfamily endonuclease